MLQEEFHSKVDDSVARRLNELIEEIQNAISGNTKVSSKDLLAKFGSFLELVSSIKSIIDFLK